MEVKSPKQKHEITSDSSHEDGEQLVRDAESILMERTRISASTSTFLLYVLLFLFAGSVFLGMLADGNTYSHLAFGAAIIAGLGITRLLK